MIPEDIIIKVKEDTEHPSTTFRVDFLKNKIIGKTDELEAVKQAVFLLLSTERNYSAIYNDYGIKLDDIIGQDINLAASELKRRIIESLKEDDRIIDAQDFTFNEINEGLEVEFTVVSIYGNFASRGVYNL